MLPISGNGERTLTDSSNVQTKKSTVKRKFPGPAGILPDDEMELCNNLPTHSQQEPSVLQEGPWKEMSKDFKISNNLYLYDKFNIAWIKKEAAASNFIKHKAPFLAAILHSIEVTDGQKQKCVNIMLKDSSGVIQGTIQYNLYQEYLNKLIVGSVLVIINFGVLSCTCEQCDNHHLTIVSKNLCVIYTFNEKVNIFKVDPDDILKNYCKKRKELENDKRKNDGLNNLVFPTINQCFNRNISNSSKFISPIGTNYQNYNVIKNKNLKSCFVSPLKTCSPNKRQRINTSIPATKTNFNFKTLDVLKADGIVNVSNKSRVNNSEIDENKKICNDLLDGIDINSLFEDF